MTLDARSFGLAGGILWGLSMALITVMAMNLGWGSVFVNLLANVYPGYTVSYFGALVGAVWGFADAFIGLYIFAYLYNWLQS